MKLLIDISDEYYKSIKNIAAFISGQRSGKSFINHLCNAVANGIPQETVTEFADRCRECGKMRTGHWIVKKDCEGKTRKCICDKCGYETGKYTWKNPNYCAECGVRMIVERNEK
jgi:hypothetical protein